MGRDLGTAFVGIVPDTSNFRTSLLAKLKAALSGTKAEVPVSLDTTGLNAQVAAVIAKMSVLQSKAAKLKLDADDTGALKTIAGIQAKLAALTAKQNEIPVGIDIAGLNTALARLRSGLQQAGIADIADINVSPAKIRSQLILVKRLVQQTGISDLLDFNTNTADLTRQLLKINSLSATIPVNFDVSALPKLPTETITIATDVKAAGLNAAIAAAQAKVAALQQQLSNLQMNADTTALVAKIAAMRAQQAKLATAMDKMTADVDINAAATKITALGAQIRALQSSASQIVIDANIAALQAKLVLAITQVNKLAASAKDITIDANTAPFIAKLAAAAAAVKAFFASGSGGGGGGGGGGAAFGFGLFGAAIAGITGNISLLHLAIDATLEAIIAVGTAAAAAAVGIAAMTPAAKDVFTQLQNIDTVNESLGNQIPALSHQFDLLAKSLAPQVVEAFGGALNFLKGNVGAFGTTARQVTTLVDDWVAKLDLWGKSQNALGGILQAGVGFLGQFATILGHLGEAIAGLLKANPGTAEFLLAIINGFTKILDWASKLPAPLLQVGLLMLSIHTWGNLLAGTLSKLPGLMGSVGTALVKLLGGPFGLLVIALTAVGFEIAKAWDTSSASVAASIAKINTSLASLSTSSQFFAIPAALGTINAELAKVSSSADPSTIEAGWTGLNGIWQRASDRLQVLIGNLKGITQGSIVHEVESLGNAFKDLFTNNSSATLVQQQRDIANLNTEINVLLGSQRNLDAETGNLIKGGYSFSQALTIMSLAGVQSTDSLALMQQKVTNLVSGFQAMSVAGGLLNSSVNALSFSSAFQSTKVQQLNSAWDLFIATVSGSESAFASVETSISGLFTAAASAGAHLTDSNGKVSSSFGTLAAVTTGTAATSLQLTAAQNGVTAANLRITAAQDRLNTLQKSGKATSAQLASAQATLATAQGTLATRQNTLNTRLSAGSAAAQGAQGSFTGLNNTSLALQQTFNSSLTSANSMLDALTAQTTASGLGAKGTTLLANSTKDLVAQMLPAARGSSTLTAELYALAQRGGFTGADSFQALAKWVGNVKSPMQDLQGNVATLTVASAGLTTDVQNLSVVLGTTLTSAMTQAQFLATGGQKAFTAFANSALTSGGNLDKMQPSANKVAQQLLELTHNTTQAKTEFLSFAIGSLGLTKTQADALWASFIKGTPALKGPTDQAAKAQTAFDNMTKSTTAAANAQTASEPIYKQAWDQIQVIFTTAFTNIKNALLTAWNSMNNAIDTALTTMKNALVTAWNAMNSAIDTAWNAIKSFFTTTWNSIGSIFTTAVTTLHNALAAGWTSITNAIDTAWNAIKSYFGLTWSNIISTLQSNFVTPFQNAFTASLNWVHANFVTPISNIFTVTLPGAFRAAVSAIGSAWSTIEGIVAAPIKVVVNNVIDPLIHLIDNVLSFVHLGSIATISLAGGGRVPGSGSGDSVPAMLTPGEVVVPKGMVAAGAVDHLRGQLPGFAAGGVVGIPGGGVLHNIVSGVKTAAGDVAGFFTSLFSGLGNLAGFAVDLATGDTSAAISRLTALIPGGAGGAGGEFGTALLDIPVALVKDAVGFLASPVKAFGAAAQSAAASKAAITGAGVSNSSAEAALQSAAAKLGWTGAQWTDLFNVEMREAGFSLTATNPSSGAYGMAQFINGPSEYAQFGGNSTTAAGQAVAMVNYIAQRYGSPAAAWAHEQAFNWYNQGGKVFDNGGVLAPGANLVWNQTGRPEAVAPVAAPGSGTRKLSADAQAIVSALRENTAAVQQQGTSFAGALNSTSAAAAYRGSYSNRRLFAGGGA
jgi:phage-related protein